MEIVTIYIDGKLQQSYVLNQVDYYYFLSNHSVKVKRTNLVTIFCQNSLFINDFNPFSYVLDDAKFCREYLVCLLIIEFLQWWVKIS